MDRSMEEAIRFISSELKDNPNANKSAIIDQAAQRFDLDPMQTEFLINKFIMNA